MPLLVLAVPDTTEGVVRPVAHEILRELFKATSIDPNTPIFYPGEHDKAIQPGSSISPQPEGVTSAFDPKVSVTIEESYQQDRVLSTAVARPENLFIFRDDRIETSIKPAYAPSELVFTIRYRAADKTSAMRWRDTIETNISMGQQERIHSVSYCYLIPPAFLKILEELHRMREAVAPYGESYQQFFRANASQRVSLLANLSGEQTAWGVAETQARVQGWFSFDGTPEQGEKDSDGDSWTITLSYHVHYDKPLTCVMRYPLVVHNQLVSRDFRPAKSDLVDRLEVHQKSYAASIESFASFEKGRFPNANLAASQPGVSIPDFDEFIPSSIPLDTLRVFTAMATIDTTDPSNLLDIRALSVKWTLHPKILAYLLRSRTKLTRLYYTPFALHLYAGRDQVTADVLEVDENLIVRTKTPLDLRQYYHVRLGLHTNWRRIDPQELDLLREDGDTLAMLLDAVDRGAADLLVRLSTGYVTRASLELALDRLDRVRLSKGNHAGYHFATVQTLYLEAIPKE